MKSASTNGTTIYMPIHGWSKCDEVPCWRAHARHMNQHYLRNAIHNVTSDSLPLDYNPGPPKLLQLGTQISVKLGFGVCYKSVS